MVFDVFVVFDAIVVFDDGGTVVERGVFTVVAFTFGLLDVTDLSVEIQYARFIWFLVRISSKMKILTQPLL